VTKIAAESEMIAQDGYTNYFMKENITGSIEKYNEAIELFRLNTNAYYYKGQACDKSGNLEEALDCYGHCIPFGKIKFQQGLLYLKLKRYSESLDAFDMATMMAPFDYINRYDKGIALYDLKEYEMALKEFNKTIILNASFSDAWYMKGLSLVRLKYSNAVIEPFEKAAELNQSNADTWYMLGKEYSKMDNCRDSAYALDKAIKLYKNSSDRNAKSDIEAANNLKRNC
jgi:tetratricopeptide (TPR) repeat protein